MGKVLGRGLEALIKTYNSDSQDINQGYKLNINQIVPNKNQPRQKFNSKSMENLIQSIREKGILQPLAVRKKEDNFYELIAGERRFRAAQAVGLKTVPVYIVNIKNESEMMELALIENIQRDNLNSMEESEGYAILSGKYNLTQGQIAKKVSKSRSEIANKLRLLKLPPVIQDSLRNGHINYGHARALISIRESTIILKIYKKIIDKKLNVRQTELLIKSIKNNSQKTLKNSANYSSYEKKLTKYLDTKLSIKKTGNTGKIIIEFDNNTELKKIITLITKN
tara:strand:- start:747 stop:1589 length:843 start_codon:yes stop_codon:yes gene_type:complete